MFVENEMAEDQVEQSEVEQQQETEEVFVLGDEVPPASEEEEQEDDPETVETEDGESTPAPQWVKDLRKESKETKRLLKQRDAELEEQKRQLEELRQRSQSQAKQPVVVEPKLPKLEDFDYDEDLHAEAMRDYGKKYAEYTQSKVSQEAEQQKAVDALRSKFEAYQQKKLAVAPKLKDFAEVEQRVISSLSVEKQNMILHAVDSNPELVVYALGKNPQLLREFANEQDPAMIGFKLGQISRDARLAPRAKKAPTAEPSVAGGGSGATNHLDRLLENARKTGDYTEYREAKRRQSK